MAGERLLKENIFGPEPSKSIFAVPTVEENRVRRMSITTYRLLCEIETPQVVIVS